jgi:hypothetical protein
MTESPEFGTKGLAARLRGTQDVVFVDVGARRIESRVTRDGVPISAHRIDPQVLRDIVIGEPVIAYRIVDQSVPAGAAVALGTSVDVVMTRGGSLPVGVVAGVHASLKATTIEQAFGRLVAGRPQARRLVARAAEGPLSDVDEQALRDLFQQAQVPIEDIPGRDLDAGLETLRVLTAFGGS